MMTDVLTPAQRRLNMSRIRSKDSKPEMIVRRGLHACGLRFRLHQRFLPGTPDLVFSKHRAAIFVNGCFWHGHGCLLSKTPMTRTAFWGAKIEANRTRDLAARNALHDLGWRTLIVWECALLGRQRLPLTEILNRSAAFVTDGQTGDAEIEGNASTAEARGAAVNATIRKKSKFSS